MSNYDSIAITKLYVYGTSNPSDDYNEHIRPLDATQPLVSYDMQEYMANGAGRYAYLSLFPIVDKFFDTSIFIDDGNYVGESEIREVITYSNTEFKNAKKIKISQYGTDYTSLDHPERAYIFGTTDFALDLSEAIFTVNNGSRTIHNVYVKPDDFNDSNTYDDNFDYQGGSTAANIVNNNVLIPAFDPYRLGREAVGIFFSGNTSEDTKGKKYEVYTEASYDIDNTVNEHLVSNKAEPNNSRIKDLEGITYLISGSFENPIPGTVYFNNIDSNPFFSYERDNFKVIYGTPNSDFLSPNDVERNIVSFSLSTIPSTFYPYLIVGGDGDDIITSFDRSDELLGGAGNDVLRGNKGDDILEGGQGDDIIYGGLGDRDTAIFSDDFEHYAISKSNLLGLSFFTFVHNSGTQEDGTDNLSESIELADFRDSIAPLKDGSFDTQSGEVPSTSTNFFDPGRPIQLGLTMPVSMIDGDAEYTVDISPFETNPQYNISFIIDTSASMDVNPTEFQEVKDAYTSLINYFKNNDIADDTNFGVVSFSKNATLYADLTADEAINTIQGLTTASPIEGTQYRDALGKGLDFFTQSPLRGENITNIAYFVSDGRSRSTYPEPTYINNARFLRSVANVQAFGLYDSTDPGTISESQINFVDSDQGVILSDASQLESAFSQSGLINDLDRIDIVRDNSVIETIQPNQLTDSPLGLSYTGTIDDLDVSLNAANNISAEVSFIPDSKIASSGTVDYTVASNLDDSGAEPLTTIVDGGAADDEIIIGSIDLGAAGNDGNDRVFGNNFDNVLNGGDGNDTLFGNEGNDTITTDSGEDLVDGGNGIDTVNYVNQTFDPDAIEQRGDVTTINSTDTLINVEYLQFSDVRVSTETLEVVPILEGTNITVTEGDAGTTITQFTFNLSSPAPNDILVSYNTEDIDAITAADYVATSGILTIPSGSTTATIDVEITGDTDYEADEIFALNLTAISGATFVDNQDQYTLVANIENDDIQTIIDPVTSLQYIAEYGVIDNLTDDFQTIDLTNNYTNPVVFAQPLSFNGPSTAAVRLDNVTGNSFEIQAQEANYLDGSHSAEKVSYFVLEAGTWQLPSGEILQVGTTNSNQLVSDEWENITFDQQFETIPAVFSQVQTKNDSDFVRTRQKIISTDGFQFGMEEEEANKNSGHGNETLGWFAIETGDGTWNGNNYQIGTTGDTVTHNWSSIDFNPNFSQAPQFLASLSSYDGSDPSGLRYRSLNQDTVEIKIEEDKSSDNETIHTTETVSYFALEGEGLLVGQPRETFAETGTISLSSAEETINLTNTYNNPVVFVQPPSFNGAQPALVRLDNITANSFDARIQEPDYLVDIGQGSHSAETLSYFVFEAGTWQLEDGTLLEIGQTNSSGLVNDSAGFETVDFDLEFDSTPIVISQVQTENETDFVRTRQRNTTLNSFDVAMEEEEANEGSGHATETIGYLAIEPGSGESGGFTYHADNTGDTVGSNWSEVDFNGLFSEAPQVLAGISSYDGFDPAGLRYRNLDPTGVEFKAEEEQSVDDELSHTRETVDFLLIEGSGSLSATPIDPFSANGAIPIAEAIGLRERLISQFEEPFN